jgi:hypothetical protein
MKLLCRIGLHNWLELGPFSFIVTWGKLFECLRCHKREARYGYATVSCEAPKEGWNDYLELNWYK